MTGNLVGIDMNMVLQLVNTLVLYFLLRHFLFKPVSEHLANRQNKIGNDLNDARDTKEEMEKLKREYHRKLDEIDERAKGIINEAVGKGEARHREIIEKAKAEAKDIVDRARREIQLERQKAMSEVMDDMVEVSIQAAEKVLERSVDSETNRRLVRDFVDRMGRVS